MASAADVAASTDVRVNVARTVEVAGIADFALVEGFAVDASLDDIVTGVAQLVGQVEEVLEGLVALDTGGEVGAVDAAGQGAKLAVVGGVVDELIQGTVAEVAEFQQTLVVVDEVVGTHHSVGDVGIADFAGVEGGAVAALVQVALLALPRGEVHEPVVLLVALVAEGHVVADQAILHQADGAQTATYVEEVPTGTVPGFDVEHGDPLPNESILAQAWLRNGCGYPDSECLIGGVDVCGIGGVSHIGSIGQVGHIGHICHIGQVGQIG